MAIDNESRQATINELDAYMQTKMRELNKPSCRQCDHRKVCDVKRKNNHTVSKSVCKHFADSSANSVTSYDAKYISKMLTLSTSHISAETSELIADEPDNNGFGLAVYEKAEFGFWIYCGDKRVSDILSELPDDLRRCIELARENDCEWLCLDCDGAEINNMPTYDW